MTEIKLPENLIEDEKDKWIKQHDRKFCFVSNFIDIRNSEIQHFESDNIKYSIRADNSFFDKGVDFSGSTYSGKAIFFISTFSGDANFSGSTFSGEATFWGCTYIEEASFYRSIFNGNAYFKKSTYSGNAKFFSSTFNEDVNFSGSRYRGEASFSGSIFNGRANFINSAYIGEADFSGSTYIGEAYFFDSTYIGKANFSKSTFNGHAEFQSSTFSGEANFLGSTFSGNAYFSSSTFNEDAGFHESTFSGEAYFSHSTFRKNTDFELARFMKLAYFHKAQFLSALILKQTNFEEYVDLRNTKIRRLDSDNRQRPAIIKVHYDLRNATISEAHFQDIIFEKDVYFSDARFGVPVSEEKDEDGAQGKIPLPTVFRYVTFEGQADFKRTAFVGNTAFENVTFINEADFTDADFRKAEKRKDADFSLSYLHFNNFRMNWDVLPAMENWVRASQKRIQSFTDRQIEETLSKELNQKKFQFREAKKELKAAKEKNENVEEEEKKLEAILNKIEDLNSTLEELKDKELEPLSSVLKTLEENFRNNKQLYDANQAFYHKKLAEREEAKEGNDKLLTWQSVEWWCWGIICGYGTKIWWVLGWSTFLTMFFAFLYYLKKDNLTRQQHPETSKEFQFRQRLLDFPKDYYSGESKMEMWESARKFVDALRFSSVILLKFGYRDTTISGKIMGIDYKYIVWAEWLLGYYILAALAVTISNTMPLINRLISGVF